MSLKSLERAQPVTVYVERALPRHAPESERYWVPLPGDVVLFGIDRESFLSRLTNALTHSEWTHTSVVTSGSPVQQDQLASSYMARSEATPFYGKRAKPPHLAPPTRPTEPWRSLSGEQLFLFESVTPLAEDGNSWDYLTGRERCGVRVVDARERMMEVTVTQGTRAAYRRVTAPSRSQAEALAERLQDAIAAVEGRHVGGNYENNPLLFTDGISDPGRVRTQEQERVLAMRNREFCSQLTAEVLREAGLLPGEQERSPRSYLPRDFGDGGSVEREIAARGFAMTPTETVKFSWQESNK